MSLIEKIEDWKKFPNALGLEAQVAVIIGQVSAELNEKIPATVKKALKILSLRGTMRDLASSANRPPEEDPLNVPPILSLVDAGASSCGISTSASATAPFTVADSFVERPSCGVEQVRGPALWIATRPPFSARYRSIVVRTKARPAPVLSVK